MLDDVTRRIIIREGALLSSTLYEHFDSAVAETRAKVRFPENQEPHAHAFYRRAAFRANLSMAPLPNEWIIDGNSRLGGQLILRHPDLGASLRVLSESKVTKDGVPHAGTSRARRAAWSAIPMFRLHGESDAHRNFLLLTNSRSEPSAMRIVHTVDPGEYKGTVTCDFDVPVLRDEAAMAATFEGADEHENFFEVDIDAEETDSV
ncbi:hypothetical protein [Microbacterium sp. CJ88]|uniref:hypothetical protein n=1 Tax=Microbacterium sp. CJ88 TaxID=3445672 RepID=UPI003F65E76D